VSLGPSSLAWDVVQQGSKQSPLCSCGLGFVLGLGLSKLGRESAISNITGAFLFCYPDRSMIRA
jgi:hypothetical protein